ncbi:MAG: MFS transporter [Anaerolineales bacterium]
MITTNQKNPKMSSIETGIKADFPERKNQKLSIASLSAAFLVDSGEEQTLPLLWPYMYTALGATVGQLGTILGISKLASTITYPLWGYLADRFSRRMLLVWFTGIWGLWTLGISFVGTYPQLLTMRVISGLGLGAFTPAAFSLIGDLFENRSRGRAVGIMRSVGLVGVVVSVMLLPSLPKLGPEGWRVGFALFGAASFLTGLWMLAIKEPARGVSEPELHNVISEETTGRYSFSRADFRSLFKIRSWRYLVINETLTKVSLSVFTGWNFTFLTGLELKLPFFYIVIFVVFLDMVVGNIFFGWLGDRLDQRFSGRGRVVMVQIGLVVQVLALVGYLTSGGENVLKLTLFALLAGSSNTASSEGGIWPVAHAILPPELRGRHRAIVSMGIGAGSALALYLSSFIADNMGVSAALLLFVPGLIFLSIFAWTPMFRAYPHDRNALHMLLTQRLENYLEQES